MALEASGKIPIGLLDLPAELRLFIYEYALAEEQAIHIKCSTKPRRINRSEGLEFWATVDFYGIILPSLASVSRAVRDESLPVFFEINTFTFETPMPTGAGHQVRISNFDTFSRFVKRTELQMFVARYRWIKITLDFRAADRSPTVTTKLWQWGDESTASANQLRRQFIADGTSQLLEHAISKQISKSTVKKDIIWCLLHDEFDSEKLQDRPSIT